MGQFHATCVFGQVRLMLAASFFKAHTQGANQLFRKNCGPIPASFPVPDDQSVHVKVDILEPGLESMSLELAGGRFNTERDNLFFHDDLPLGSRGLGGAHGPRPLPGRGGD